VPVTRPGQPLVQVREEGRQEAADERGGEGQHGQAHADLERSAHDEDVHLGDETRHEAHGHVGEQEQDEDGRRDLQRDHEESAGGHHQVVQAPLRQLERARGDQPERQRQRPQRW
jgi:hypothetical protein